MKRVWAGAVCALPLMWTLVGWQAFAQPALSTVDDVIYRADGQPLNGWAQIEWKSFLAADASTIAAYSKNVLIVDGVLKVNLTPTTTAPAGAYYLVKYFISGRLQFTEYWAVRPSATPLKLKDIRLVGPPPGGTATAGAAEAVAIGDVVGLTDELNSRPKRGLGFAASRAVVSSGSGELNAAVGEPTDCVRVNGTTGPCGGSSGPGFTDHEAPAGLINGTNTVFTLANAPVPATSLQLYRNGLLQRVGLDFTLSGNTITFLADAIPQGDDVLSASYRLADGSQPAGQAAGALTGFFPAPSIASGAIADFHVAANAAIAESKLALTFPTHSSQNDPSAEQKAALAGTSGSPGGTNRYVTDQDPRMTNVRPPMAHSMLSGAHADTNPGVAVRGDLIVAQGGSPAVFTRLGLGAPNRCLISNGSDAVWNACLFTGFPAGSIPFVDSTGNLAQNASRLFWDNSQRRLGVGVNAPVSTLMVQDPSVTDGVTTVTVRAGQTQGATPLGRWQNHGGSDVATVGAGGELEAAGFRANGAGQAGWQETGLVQDPVSPAAGSMWFHSGQAVRKSGEGGQAHPIPQVICSIAGASTSSTTPVLLGRCRIPSNLIQAGDRFEVRYHLTHEGGTSPFSYSVRWGGTVMLARSSEATEALSAGQVGATPGASELHWTWTVWGGPAAFAAGGSSSALGSGDALVEAYGQLSASSTDTVTLRNLSLVRVPAQVNP